MTLVRCVVLVGLALLTGCSSQPRGTTSPEVLLLREVNDLLHSAAGAAGQPPARLADLDRYQAMYPRGYEAVKSGEVVVLWSTPLQGEGEVGKDEGILAYEKGVPTRGGHVLLSAGTVKQMTAADFAAASKKGHK
jgi:hypothetical protein